MDINEKALLYRAHAGDKGAAGALYEQYYRDIYSYIFYRVDDAETAEKLSAEVFVRMIRQLPGYLEQGKPFISWLYSLARKIIKDFHKRQMDSGEEIEQTSTEHNDNEQYDQGQEALGCFQRALQHLSGPQKELIIHRFVEGRSLEDIADLIQQSERAVKALQLKALMSLEKALEQEDCL